MKKIIYTRPDGGVSVVHPVEGDRRQVHRDDTVTKWAVIEPATYQDVPSGVFDPQGNEITRREVTRGQAIPILVAQAVTAVANNDGKSVPLADILPADHDAIAGFDHASAFRLEADDEFAARIAAKDVPADAVDMEIVDEADLPTDRTDRDAWVIDKAPGRAKAVKADPARRAPAPLEPAP